MNRGYDRSATNSRRRPRRRRGQTLVEFALVIPIFLTLVVSIAEFAFMFSSYLSLSFTARDGSEVAAELGSSPCADSVILQRIDTDMTAPVDKSRISTVEIFWAAANGSPNGGAINTWQRSGSTDCTTPSGTITVPYTQTGNGYPIANRCNILSAAGCASGHTALDTIGIRITYTYTWITPFPGMLGGSGSGMTMQQTALTRLEPVQ